ncbi:Pr6Pr family membrane protein [Chitinophaga lutea]
MHPRVWALAGALTGWFAIVTQLILFLKTTTVSPAETIVRFFGYFTITTNILAALCLTLTALGIRSALSRPSSVYALTVYMLIVGIVYNIVLRPLWAPQGLQRLVDELLHSVQPVLLLLFWIFFTPKADLERRDFVPWLLYPIIYMAYIITLGAFTGHYPYPFADAGVLGYPRALMNGLWILFGAWALAWILLVTTRKWGPEGRVD